MLRVCTLIRVAYVNSRFLCTGTADSASSKTVKEALKKLRKRTGYSYVNCRKALLEFGPDRLNEAEKWLKDLAVKEGWEKAAKLSSRQTRNGLISAISDNNVAAVVEINCETDFVARNEEFKKLVEKVAIATLNSAKKRAKSNLGEFSLNPFNEDLDKLITNDGQFAKEVVTLAIGKLGENITVTKVLSFMSSSDIFLCSYAHPREGTALVDMGKFVSIVALKRPMPDSFPTEKLGRQICQHVIGMKSEEMGAPPEKNEQIVDAAKERSSAAKREDEDDEQDEFIGTPKIDENERRLLRQSFMLNPSQSVFDYVSGHGAEIVDFYRAEIGEDRKRED